MLKKLITVIFYHFFCLVEGLSSGLVEEGSELVPPGRGNKLHVWLLRPPGDRLSEVRFQPIQLLSHPDLEVVGKLHQAVVQHPHPLVVDGPHVKHVESPEVEVEHQVHERPSVLRHAGEVAVLVQVFVQRSHTEW